MARGLPHGRSAFRNLLAVASLEPVINAPRECPARRHPLNSARQTVLLINRFAPALCAWVGGCGLVFFVFGWRSVAAVVAGYGHVQNAGAKVAVLCEICKVQQPNFKSMAIHWENKHPKVTFDAEVGRT